MADEPTFEFLDDVPKKEVKKRGFIDQVKDFFKVTEGGAIPQPLACKILGISRQRMHQLIQKEELHPGTGIKAYRFAAAPNTVLVSVEDVDRHHALKKKYPKGGHQAKLEQEAHAKSLA